MFKGKMVTPATPERVFALCKIVEKESAINIQALKEKMEPSFLSQSTSYYADYRTAAEELGLIKIEDNMVSLAVDSDVIKSISAMRQYINAHLELFSTGQFYRVTQQFFEYGDTVFEKDKNVAAWAQEMGSLTGDSSIDAPAMRGWRFWSAFLGFGYLHEMFVIPNASQFLLDLINQSDLEEDRLYSFGEFVSTLRPLCNILISSEITNRSLNYGVSAGLRSLHDRNIIELKHIMDQEDIWNLYPMPAHTIKGTVTNIIICRRSQ